jgi:NAD(P)H dehydrogenase (quinone)
VRMSEQHIKAAIVYYSSTGSVHHLAESIANGAHQAGAEVRLVRAEELAPASAIDANEAWRRHADATAHIPIATTEDIEWADVVIFGTPTRFGNVSAQLKQLIDQCGPLWSQGKLVDKVVSGFTSASTLHGGHESTLLALYATMYHWGCIVVTPGYTADILMHSGNPYGSSNISSSGSHLDDNVIMEAAQFQGRRTVEVAQRLHDLPPTPVTESSTSG